MQAVSIELPDIIFEYHNTESVKEELKTGLVILEYLNGRLTLGECGNILKTGYRGFIELLWSKGIPIDGLNAT